MSDWYNNGYNNKKGKGAGKNGGKGKGKGYGGGVKGYSHGYDSWDGYGGNDFDGGMGGMGGFMGGMGGGFGGMGPMGGMGGMGGFGGSPPMSLMSPMSLMGMPLMTMPRSRPQDQNPTKREQEKAARQARIDAGEPIAPKKKKKEEAVGEKKNQKRSPELHLVRKDPTRTDVTLLTVRHVIVEFARDQHGSRFLQTKMDEGLDDASKAIVFNGVLPETKLVAKDPFGHFVVQKLFEECTNEERHALVNEMKGEVLVLAMDQHGCRVVQQALEHSPPETQKLIAEELKGHVGECVQNLHANHVVQRCVEKMRPEDLDWIIEVANENFEKMVTDMYGCRVIQRLLENIPAVPYLEVLLDLARPHAAAHIEDQYANYVVQHILQSGRLEDKRRIINIVIEHLMQFSMNKCSSNVAEKCFEISCVGEHAADLTEERERLFEELIDYEPEEDEQKRVITLAEDRFGNYIVQRMLEHGEGDFREKLQEQLVEHVPVFQESPTGEHILGAMNRALGLNIPIPGMTSDEDEDEQQSQQSDDE